MKKKICLEKCKKFFKMLEISLKKLFVVNLFSIFFRQNLKENFEHTFQTILGQFFFIEIKNVIKCLGFLAEMPLSTNLFRL